MKVHDGKWDTDDYNYCEEHRQYYKKYCYGCSLAPFKKKKGKKK